MKSFLEELAQNVFSDFNRNLEKVTVVFPNRRASLYFRKHLAALFTRPAFSPTILTIEDFIGRYSTLKVPEKLQLVHRLYTVYNEVSPAAKIDAEPFDQFYFWGEMLLRDFDEADKYLVQTDQLFRDLSHQKEIDSGFDFLTEEQRSFLRGFWMNFDERDSVNKQKFLDTWRTLPAIYKTFRDSLLADGTAYEGLLHRDVAENIESRANVSEFVNDRPLVFAGFNALTGAEERILSHFIQQSSATIHWDMDSYYFHNQVQEAGRFFREYSQHSVLGQTFIQDVPANFKKKKDISLYAAPQMIGQAKLMAQTLRQKLSDGYVAEDTLVVLPDEKLLFPVLHSIAGTVDKLNVTMGFPLSSTPLYNLIELLIELQLSQKDDHYNHYHTVALLGHPYVVAADPANAQAKRKEILHKNWVSIPAGYLASETELHRRIFVVPVNVPGKPYSLSIIRYLRSVVEEIGSLESVTDFDREYCLQFIQLLNRLEEVFLSGSQRDAGDKTSTKQEIKSFQRLFRQVARSEKIPFSGEPLRGLQVMGVLETRNLDFKNVFILSLNEGAFPAFAGKGSYIPYNIRKAYGMPTVEKQDAMYAYLFYRAIQRAENVHLFYNSETDDLGQGEMSRYLQQLIFESGLTLKKHVLHNDLQPISPSAMVVEKDRRVFEALAAYCDDSLEKLSPTALNDYLECRLKFYFRYVARIREPKEVEEDLDARVLGNFLHRIMEYFYEEIIQRKDSLLIEQADLQHYEPTIQRLIDRVFIENYRLDPNKPVSYDGQRLIVREIVKRFIDRIIEIDSNYAPFTIEALERNDIRLNVKVGNTTVHVGGSIDRADRKGDVLRIIDYKTGKDQLSFTDIPSLFSREKKRNKAAFQTFMYTLLFKQVVTDPNVKLVPGLMNRINVFNDNFRFGLLHGKEFLEDASPLLPDFEEKVTEVLHEIFNPEVAFDQTNDSEACQFCSYSHLCYR